MASSNVVKQLGGRVKPILSLNETEARRRVLNLYRAWFRQIPYICFELDLPINEKQLRNKVRELFLSNRNITDIRVIDMLVIRGQMELNDTINKFKSDMHVMAYFNENRNPKDFLSKFLSGYNNQ
ncbi:NADH dehydrogenase [ubiquinone] 1 alpha subcomplex subunit 6 [Sarcoptes scabiei]|uniref:NADH dehydrogenase [ubiquinone] 1 alpha subcomplex subunit 6 n=1 Tax=Sarcoptes scabiei TaxID=52283 RepID=A0A132AGN2_SARSC|nr:NADH dehydrogenase [ubiquinone] 1 alpha subcomplex subunit 6 [Sarcoptes scabiei]KPM10093.1 NADH dehydrogenase [ubiquinone] 1 alpha subcomplex subunit 6-like protein [Sarcoptes scabiei]UXI21505.1 Protein RMD5-like protein [Sarcoptes scabiei]